jgi:hypothetical protein
MAIIPSAPTPSRTAKKAQAGMAGGHDRGERLVHLVRDGGAYLSQRRHPAGVSQRGLCGVQCGLRLPALCNVHQDADDFLLARCVLLLRHAFVDLARSPTLQEIRR